MRWIMPFPFRRRTRFVKYWQPLKSRFVPRIYGIGQVPNRLSIGNTLNGLSFLYRSCIETHYTVCLFWGIAPSESSTRSQDLQIIETVGQQAALSIANIALVEDLRGLAQQLVRSDEEQRKKVAQDLHDSVLQTLFFIKQRIPSSDPEAVSLLDRITTILRQTIKAQRPSLLDQGLILALQDLIGDMRQLAE